MSDRIFPILDPGERLDCADQIATLKHQALEIRRRVSVGEVVEADRFHLVGLVSRFDAKHDNSRLTRARTHLHEVALVAAGSCEREAQRLADAELDRRLAGKLASRLDAAAINASHPMRAIAAQRLDALHHGTMPPLAWNGSRTIDHEAELRDRLQADAHGTKRRKRDDGGE